MRRFQFRLQSILDLRRKELDQRTLELGAISQQCARLAREIEDRVQLRRSTLVQRRFGTGEGGALPDWAAAEAYALRLSREAEDLRRRLAEAEAEREQVQERYREARRNVDVLERLRERREAAYTADQKREEQRFLDEVGLHMAAKRSE